MFGSWNPNITDSVASLWFWMALLIINAVKTWLTNWFWIIGFILNHLQYKYNRIVIITLVIGHYFLFWRFSLFCLHFTFYFLQLYRNNTENKILFIKIKCREFVSVAISIIMQVYAIIVSQSSAIQYNATKLKFQTWL